MRRRVLALAVMATALVTAPASAQTDSLPALRWNVLANELSRQAALLEQQQYANVKAAERVNAVIRRSGARTAVMNIVMYLASESARHSATPASQSAAAAAAAAATLTHYMPENAALIQREYERDIEAARAHSSAAQLDAGIRLGRALAERVMARADAKREKWHGTIPKGPGMWWSEPGVELGFLDRLTATPWALITRDQFRPAPPPAFGSAEFNAALEEVRRVARERTAEQTRIAQFWGLEGAPEIWARFINQAVLANKLDDGKATRLYALVSIAMTDAGIACGDAKYHYVLLRPSQADSTITFAPKLVLPNFPSYPSGHACLSGAIAEVVGHFIPAVRDEFRRLAEEAAMSRLYAGVHFRFDNDVGLALGRAVAGYVIAEDAAGRLTTRW